MPLRGDVTVFERSFLFLFILLGAVQIKRDLSPALIFSTRLVCQKTPRWMLHYESDPSGIDAHFHPIMFLSVPWFQHRCVPPLPWASVVGGPGGLLLLNTQNGVWHRPAARLEGTINGPAAGLDSITVDMRLVDTPQPPAEVPRNAR